MHQEQVQQSLDIVRDEVVKTEAHIRNLEAQIEKIQEAHNYDCRIYAQRVTHLEFEHERNLETEQQSLEKQQQADLAAHEAERQRLLSEKGRLQSDIHRQQVEYEEDLQKLLDQQKKEQSKLHEQFEAKHAELHAFYEDKLSELSHELELRRRIEQHELEERKSRHLNNLIEAHEKNFAEIKTYYNEITKDNLSLIRELNVSVCSCVCVCCVSAHFSLIRLSHSLRLIVFERATCPQLHCLKRLNRRTIR